MLYHKHRKINEECKMAERVLFLWQFFFTKLSFERAFKSSTVYTYRPQSILASPSTPHWERAIMHTTATPIPVQIASSTNSRNPFSSASTTLQFRLTNCLSIPDKHNLLSGFSTRQMNGCLVYMHFQSWPPKKCKKKTTTKYYVPSSIERGWRNRKRAYTQNECTTATKKKI